MMRNLIAGVAGAVGLLVLMPATQASAAHRLDGFGGDCSYRTSTAENGVWVGVEGVGSDVPYNSLVAGRAHVASDAWCNHVGGVRTARVRIDRVYLLNGTKILAKTGSSDSTTHDVSLDTRGVPNISCSANLLRVYVHFTTWQADGTVGEGDFYGPYFSRC
jgi:hypothetical protein